MYVGVGDGAWLAAKVSGQTRQFAGSGLSRGFDGAAWCRRQVCVLKSSFHNRSLDAIPDHNGGARPSLMIKTDPVAPFEFLAVVPGAEAAGRIIQQSCADHSGERLFQTQNHLASGSPPTISAAIGIGRARLSGAITWLEHLATSWSAGEHPIRCSHGIV
jgi:hypothetical protein